MTEILSKNIYGFEIEDSYGSHGDHIYEDHVYYNLSSSQNLLVGRDGQRLEAYLQIADYGKDDLDEFFETLSLAEQLRMNPIIAVDQNFNDERSTNTERSLAERLKPYEHIVKRGFERFFCGRFNEPDYGLLLAQCADPERFDQFLESCLTVTVEEAKRSLVSHKPNYNIHTLKLLEGIAKYLGREIVVNNIPQNIEGFTRYNGGTLSELVDNSKYVRAIVQPNGSSFTYNPAMQRTVLRLTSGLEDDLAKSRAIFDWICLNVKYGKNKRRRILYRGALQVYLDREGVCGELAALQVTMERLAGNIAYLALIGEDHCCVAHIRPSGEVVLVDNTKSDFDSQNEFKIVSDDHSLAKY